MQRNYSIVRSITYHATLQIRSDCNAKCNAHLAALHTPLKKGLCNAKCNALELNYGKDRQMGEAERRKTLVYGIRQEVPKKDSAEALVGSVLQNIADILGSAIFLKGPGDDLLDWQLDSIIGQTLEITKVRECPFIKDIREKPLPRLHWEFLITDAFLFGAYVVDAMKRGLPFPGPINPPECFPEHVRKWFQTALPKPGGWKGVIPTIDAALASQTNGAKAN
jgi:hypothetical protein